MIFNNPYFFCCFIRFLSLYWIEMQISCNQFRFFSEGHVAFCNFHRHHPYLRNLRLTSFDSSQSSFKLHSDQAYLQRLHCNWIGSPIPVAKSVKLLSSAFSAPLSFHQYLSTFLLRFTLILIRVVVYHLFSLDILLFRHLSLRYLSPGLSFRL